MGDQNKPGNSGEHYVSENNYEELLALAQCESCKWHENYHPTTKHTRSQKRPKCKDLPPQEAKNDETNRPTNDSKAPAGIAPAKEPADRAPSPTNEAKDDTPRTSDSPKPDEGYLALEQPEDNNPPEETSEQTETIDETSNTSRANEPSNVSDEPVGPQDVSPHKHAQFAETDSKSEPTPGKSQDESDLESLEGSPDIQKTKSGHQLKRDSASEPNSPRQTQPDEASIPPLRNQSDSDLVHHHVFNQTGSSPNIVADRNEEESQPDAGNRKRSSATDDQPPSKGPIKDLNKIPDGSPVTDSIYDDLVALGKCSNCDWSRNYHPCFDPDSGLPNHKCDEWNIPFDYYDDDLEEPTTLQPDVSIKQNATTEEGVKAVPKNKVETQEATMPEDAPTQNVESENKNLEGPNGSADPGVENVDDVAPTSEEMKSTETTPLNNAAVEEGAENPNATGQSRKPSQTTDADEDVVMVYVSRSTYEELLARGKLLDKPEK